MMSITLKGDFDKLSKRLEKMKEKVHLGKLDKYGKQGVAALQAATPKDTGLTANSWYYEITNTANSVTLAFSNSNIQNGVPIAIVLEYGHGTPQGGYVQGRRYIEPALQPIFDQIAQEAWKEVIVE